MFSCEETRTVQRVSNDPNQNRLAILFVVLCIHMQKLVLDDDYGRKM